MPQTRVKGPSTLSLILGVTAVPAPEYPPARPPLQPTQMSVQGAGVALREWLHDLPQRQGLCSRGKVVLKWKLVAHSGLGPLPGLKAQTPTREFRMSAGHCPQRSTGKGSFRTECSWDVLLVTKGQGHQQPRRGLCCVSNTWDDYQPPPHQPPRELVRSPCSRRFLNEEGSQGDLAAQEGVQRVSWGARLDSR